MSGLNTTPFLLRGGEGRAPHAGGCIGLHGIARDVKDNLDLKGLPKAMRSQLPEAGDHLTTVLLLITQLHLQWRF